MVFASLSVTVNVKCTRRVNKLAIFNRHFSVGSWQWQVLSIHLSHKVLLPDIQNLADWFQLFNIFRAGELPHSEGYSSERIKTRDQKQNHSDPNSAQSPKPQTAFQARVQHACTMTFVLLRVVSSSRK